MTSASSLNQPENCVTLSLLKPLLAAHPTLDAGQVWVLLWCQSSGHTHIETLDAMFKAHARAFRENTQLRFIPLLLGDRDVVDAAVVAMRPILAARIGDSLKGRA